MVGRWGVGSGGGWGLAATQHPAPSVLESLPPPPPAQAYIKQYLQSDGSDIAWDFIRAAMRSVAKTSIIMMQVGGSLGVARAPGRAPRPGAEQRPTLPHASARRLRQRRGRASA